MRFVNYFFFVFCWVYILFAQLLSLECSAVYNIWHKRHKFYKVSLLHAKIVWLWFQKTLFLSEHAAVYYHRSKSCLQILKTAEYQLIEYHLSNNVTITSFCFVNKSCLANSLFSNKMERLHMLQKWLSCGMHAAHCPDFIDKDSWLASSLDMNPLDYHVWGSMLQNFCHLNPQPKDKGHPGTEVSACEDLGRVTTRHNLQVDCEFREASASLCKRRLRTFWAFSVTLLIDLTYVCHFCNFESKKMLEKVVIN